MTSSEGMESYWASERIRWETVAKENVQSARNHKSLRSLQILYPIILSRNNTACSYIMSTKLFQNEQINAIVVLIIFWLRILPIYLRIIYFGFNPFKFVGKIQNYYIQF